MKKNKSLSSCYLAAYFLWVFGVILSALMFLKLGIGLMIALFAIAVIVLGAIIVSHVLYNKKQFNLYIYFSFASHGLASRFKKSNLPPIGRVGVSQDRLWRAGARKRVALESG